ncbi:unnamed protein product [Toxocara canis]|uniref:Zpr1 domain-containing protein n=1 Tax=Toxocara canis TaxID=6265 RepID=A0A183UDT9_TOXCA|nr:unnamed protein product [Toxocara canis]
MSSPSGANSERPGAKGVFICLQPNAAMSKKELVIGGDMADRLIPVPLSSAPTDQAIRVVKAFQAGLDRREPSLSGPSAARLREISRQLKLQVEHEGKDYRKIVLRVPFQGDTTRPALNFSSVEAERGGIVGVRAVGGRRS